MATSGSGSPNSISSPSSQKGYKCTLPPERVFSIQIGTELFRLSGASIASDAPSYFSQFFEEQLRHNGDGANIRTLYIDRDPVTFKDIVRHLQGYYVRPRDSSQFVKLFADAQFYSLPRLNSQLFESEISIQIGDRNFQIPRDIFSSPGDSPNFFTLGFGAFFASPSQTFPGLERIGLLRPPAIVPPSIPNRSGDVFADILHLLRGYPLHIRNETHRAELLRDCRYFHLRGLEQKLIPHDISFNPVRQRSEITIRLEDVRRSGINFAPDPTPNPNPNTTTNNPSPPGWITYSRPFIDDQPIDLIVEIGDECTLVDLSRMRAQFLHLTKTRFASLVQVISNKITSSQAPSSNSTTSTPPATNPPTAETSPLRIDRDADLILDGQPVSHADIFGSPDPSPDSAEQLQPPAKRRRGDGSSGLSGKWIVRTGQWRLRAVPAASGAGDVDVVMVAVKLDAYSEPRMRSRGRGFLGS
ncbi:hypothetical protein P170DRAFT_440796 [Aspergillus steynii IBT 23096]|uniref:Potassium channel tetramerisation-type BTB domain-containing protein n=1 Tax=Aspergillus steynii IBT 23096 TaxID=1392250 RepID=A0A2I2FV62_9EURO|nr:uncharacterized protein P170DRAFT_440796 [Aspergillus steynii IBT 23096]PLB44530.1 hypothetical protein P170DRAFT_440796 [Aspergillus steynii IBT 23096]